MLVKHWVRKSIIHSNPWFILRKFQNQLITIYLSWITESKFSKPIKLSSWLIYTLYSKPMFTCWEPVNGMQYPYNDSYTIGCHYCISWIIWSYWLCDLCVLLGFLLTYTHLDLCALNVGWYAFLLTDTVVGFREGHSQDSNTNIKLVQTKIEKKTR